MDSITYNQILTKDGLIPFSFNLPESWKELVQNRLFEELYQKIETSLQRDKDLWSQIDQKMALIYSPKQKWEYEWMLALREGPQEEDQEGIWHDDSSRDLALSLSLNLDPQSIEGGELRLRHRSNREIVTSVKARPWGQAHIFATGKWDWEHKTSRVTLGNRLVLVVWLSLTP